jgi:hypothetical protein
MKKKSLFLFFLLALSVATIQAQTSPVKNYTKGHKAGDVLLVYSMGEISNGVPYRVYAIDVRKEDKFYLSTLVNLQKEETMSVYIDDQFFDKFIGQANGWQYLSITSQNITLTPGKHILRFEGNSSNGHVPMADEISLTINRPTGRAAAPTAISNFLQAVDVLKQQPVISVAGENEAGDLTTKVLPNPQGTYDHAIDTTFSYSHFSYIYLAAGVHNFATSGSTISRALTIFNPTNFSNSSSNVNSGPGGESSLAMYVTTPAYYVIMLRPYTSGTGTTNIIYNGSTLVSNAVIGGRTYAMSSLKGGPLNFFTCRLTAGDTRMIASRYFASSARGYNDDYYGGGGDWSWGYASRIKKDFIGVDSVQYGYVCAYSPTSTGVSDVYLGNQNSEVNLTNYPEFPLLKADDAIRAAPNTGMYNCISWSGGVTATWIWPPSQYSTYNCTSAPGNVTCFDNFYSNNPVRYPGAWNYTRTGATVNNAIVDLWKLNTNYTHASVRKPGNNHPHGYDWESKPGGTARTFHPRNALTNLSWGYGAVTNYYIPTGTYARNAATSFETDADAVKAGLAIFDVARLTTDADKKLNTLLRKTDLSFTSQFNTLYEEWKKTWESNAIYSDPAMYCKNSEFDALAKLAAKNNRQAMLIVFDKFVNQNDHPIGELMWTLTQEKYGHLLTEVKTERAAAPNDAQGRYRIHGDHDNGVLYVEKILKLLQDEVEVTVADNVQITVSPNPVTNRLTVQITTDKMARVSVTAISAQTRQTKVLQPEAQLAAGTHRFSMEVKGFAGKTGDIIGVQVLIDGQLKTVKVLVAQ